MTQPTSSAQSPDVPHATESTAGTDSATSAGPSAAVRWRTKAPYLLISLAVLVLDQWSKWWIEGNLTAGRALEIIPGFLDFIYVRNTGVAFGLFASHGDPRGTLLLTALGLAALAFVSFYFWIVPLWDRVLTLALALVLGGAVGNLLDRMLQGGVTDFIDAYVGTYHWHTFNVADSAITVGIGLMLYGALRPAHDPDAPTEVDGDGGSQGDRPAA
ncbi:MAG: signal peptidase II [Acidobacteriota bacterium]